MNKISGFLWTLGDIIDKLGVLLKDHLNKFSTMVLNSLRIVEYIKNQFKKIEAPSPTEGCIIKRSKELSKTALNRL